MREGERAEKQFIVMATNIEILDILGVNDKVREGERAEKQSIVMAINPILTHQGWI